MDMGDGTAFFVGQRSNRCEARVGLCSVSQEIYKKITQRLVALHAAADGREELAEEAVDDTADVHGVTR